jgi:corrinoid protein of di/trimethylamine methyltransferase
VNVNNQIFEAMAKSIEDGEAEDAKRLAEQAVAQGIDPLEAINNGFVKGVNAVGEGFSRGDLFLPELVLAGEAMKAAVSALEPEMKRRGSQRESAGRVVLGTVEGDIHDIGKTLVATMLAASGFEVHDLGSNVPLARIIEKTRELEADIVGLSAMLTTTMVNQRKFIQMLGEAGLRDRVKVMVGGAPVTRSWAEEIGADGYSEDSFGAVKVAKEMLGR